MVPVFCKYNVKNDLQKIKMLLYYTFFLRKGWECYITLYLCANSGIDVPFGMIVNSTHVDRLIMEEILYGSFCKLQEIKHASY